MDFKRSGNVSSIIMFQPSEKLRFSVHEHKIIDEDKHFSKYRMIVLKDQSGFVVQFTGLENFVCEYTSNMPRTNFRSKAELMYICNSLNFIFEHNNIRCISDITVDMILAYLRAYAKTPKVDGTQLFRSKQSVSKCTHYVCHFFANLSLAYEMKYKPEDLLQERFSKRNAKTHRIDLTYVPILKVRAEPGHKRMLLRDIPEKAAWRLVELALVHDPMIAFAIVCQILAGLRAGEAMNLRQEGSPLSNTPGIFPRKIGSAIAGIELDLTQEFVLRSDFVSVGGIKKERTVDVYKNFVATWMYYYRIHQRILQQHKVEAAFMPMFINHRGKAMTYATYAQRVVRLTEEKLVPEMLQSDDMHCVLFAKQFATHSFGPHAFRHLFTCKLLQEGLNRDDIMYYRGDTSPESATVYLQNKKALLDPANAMHNKALDALSKVGRWQYESD